jgi:hypothetical protein
MRVSFVAVLAALALLGASPAEDGRYFVGTWTCAGETWTFAPLIAGSDWLRVTYEHAGTVDGTAVMGFVNGLQAWVYRDFHADGSYADLTSSGNADGRWTWNGPYYPASGGAPLNGRITYTEVDRDRYDRTFESLRNGTLVKLGGDRCTRTPASSN